MTYCNNSFFFPRWMLRRHHSCCDSHHTLSNKCGAAKAGLAQMVAQKAGTPPMQVMTAPGPPCLSRKDIYRLSRLKSFQFMSL